MEKNESAHKQSSSSVISPGRSNSTSIRNSSSGSKKARNEMEAKKRMYDSDTFFQLSPCSWGRKVLTSQDMDSFLCHEDFGKVLRLAFQVKVLAARRKGTSVAIPGAECLTDAQWNEVVKSIIQHSLSKRLGSATTVITRGQSPKTDHLIDKAISSFTLQLEEGGYRNASGNDQEDIAKNAASLDLSDNKSCGDGVAVKYSKKQTDILTQWMIDHRDHPFPNATEIMKLCDATNLSYSQVVNWTTNVRKRNLKATVEGGKKPHHFLDFVFLAHDRERRHTIAASGAAGVDQSPRMRPRQLTLPLRPPSRQQSPEATSYIMGIAVPPKIQSEEDQTHNNIHNCGAYSDEVANLCHGNTFPELFPSMDISMDSIDLDLIEQSAGEDLQDESSSSPNVSNLKTVPAAAAKYREHRDFWEEIVESCLPGNILDVFDDVNNLQHSMKFSEELDTTEDLRNLMHFDTFNTADSFQHTVTSPLKHKVDCGDRSISPVLLFSTEPPATSNKNNLGNEENSCGSFWQLNDESNNRPNNRGDTRQHCIPESDTSSDEEGINIIENELLFDKSFLMSADFSLFEPIPEEDLLEELIEPMDRK